MHLPISSGTMVTTGNNYSLHQEIEVCVVHLLWEIQDRSNSHRVMRLHFLSESQYWRTFEGSLLKKATSLSIPLASLKFPPVASISYSTSRTKDWDDIVTAHTDEPFARTWTMLGKKVGKYSLGLADNHKSKNKGKSLGNIGSIKVILSFIKRHAFLVPKTSWQAVCVTACGNFALASSSAGQINMWNMQSGIQRKTYILGPCPPEVAARFYSGTVKRSDRSITGLASDSLNSIVIASTLDGTLNVSSYAVHYICWWLI